MEKVISGRIVILYLWFDTSSFFLFIHCHKQCLHVGTRCAILTSCQPDPSADLHGSYEATLQPRALPIRGPVLLNSPHAQHPAADLSGVYVWHIWLETEGRMWSHPRSRPCAEIDAPMAARLSQQPKLCGGNERWVEVTLRVSGYCRLTCSVAAMAVGDGEW